MVQSEVRSNRSFQSDPSQCEVRGVVIEKARCMVRFCPMALSPTKVASLSQQRGYEISLCRVNQGAKNN